MISAYHDLDFLQNFLLVRSVIFIARVLEKVVDGILTLSMMPMRVVQPLLFAFVAFSLFWTHRGACAETFCREGIFSVPNPKYPGPLVGFGENFIGANQVQVSLYGDDFIGRDKNYVDIVPWVLYGITDAASVYVAVPVTPQYKENGRSSRGFEDLWVQFEVAPYTKRWPCAFNQLTVVANASFPTGSSTKKPHTGYGAMGYFLGTTYFYTTPNWFVFTAYGGEFPTSHKGTKFGSTFLYQGGGGTLITSGKGLPWGEGWVLAWVLEWDGYLSGRDRYHDKRDPNSGGNVFYITPSLWVSTFRWYAQLGWGFAVSQHLNGNQKRDQYLFIFNFAWTL